MKVRIILAHSATLQAALIQRESDSHFEAKPQSLLESGFALDTVLETEDFRDIPDEFCGRWLEG